MSWNKPLVHRWKFNLLELSRYIQDQISRTFHHGTGNLQRSFGFNTGVIKLNPEKNGIEIRNPLEYAEIQNSGGYIPERVPVNAQALHFFKDGEEIFAKRAAGFFIEPKNYVEEGIENWLSGTGELANINIGWIDDVE